MLFFALTIMSALDGYRISLVRVLSRPIINRPFAREALLGAYPSHVRKLLQNACINQLNHAVIWKLSVVVSPGCQLTGAWWSLARTHNAGEINIARVKLGPRAVMDYMRTSTTCEEWNNARSLGLTHLWVSLSGTLAFSAHRKCVSVFRRLPSRGLATTANCGMGVPTV